MTLHRPILPLLLTALLMSTANVAHWSPFVSTLQHQACGTVSRDEHPAYCGTSSNRSP